MSHQPAVQNFRFYRSSSDLAETRRSVRERDFESRRHCFVSDRDALPASCPAVYISPALEAMALPASDSTPALDTEPEQSRIAGDTNKSATNSASATDATATGAAADPSTEWPKDTKEIDAVFAPRLAFPPFPKPPLGVEIIPFTEFKPLGIHIREEKADGEQPPEEQQKEGDDKEEGGYVEVDGLGIPTMGLRVHHELTPMERERKGKRKSKKGLGGRPARVLWYEEWAETENSRRLSVPLDQYVAHLFAHPGYSLT